MIASGSIIFAPIPQVPSGLPRQPMETAGQSDTRYVTEAAPRATRREWIGLGVIALPCVIYSMDLTVLFLAVPSLTADLNPSSTQLLWISDIYGFMVAGALIPMGTLGDRIG